MPAIRVELELADGSFTTRMLHAGETLRQFEQNVTRTSPALQALSAAGINVVRSFELGQTSAKGFLSTLRDVSIVTGILAVGIGKLTNIQNTWVGDIIRVNSEMERLNFQMRSMSTASDPIKDAAASVQFLRAQALDMPLTLQSITNGFVKLKATGTDPLSGALTSLADGVAAFGGSDEAFGRSILAISQMSGKGVIQMEELRQQLGESMPRAVELMARSMGISMARLIDDIATGTLQAKPALQLFYDELDRTYGGRARYMMQTFEGQLKRTVTAVQLLSTTGGAGFFEEVKTQVEDLADFLTSNTAEVLAQQIGNAMTAVVRAIRGGLDWLIEFRREAGRIAVVIGAAFGFKLAVSGLNSLVTALQLTRTQLTATGLAWANASAAAGFFNQTIAGSAPVMTVARAGMGAMAATATALIGTLSAVAPWIAIIGVGIYAAAEYFGVFSNKVKDAYENLREFGAESREQAITAIDARLKQLKEWAKRFEELNVQPGDSGRGKVMRDTLAEIATIEAEASDLIAAAAKREDDKSMTRFREALDEKLQVAKGAYDRESIAAQDHFNTLEADAARAGKSTEEIDKERAARLLELRLNLAAEQNDVLRSAIAEEEAQLRSRNQTEIVQARQHLTELRSMLVDNLEEMTRLRTQESGAPVLPKVISDTELFKKGQKNLERIMAEVKGLEAGLSGASTEATELFELMQDGKYGPADRVEVKKLIDEIVEAQKQKEKLDELLKGKKSLENDIEQARIKALEERMRLEEEAGGKQLSESEKIKIRIEQGYYAGFGPSSKTRQLLEGIVAAFDVQGTAAAQVGSVMRDNTFGSQTVSKVNSVTEAVIKLSNAIMGISTGLGQVDFAGLRMPANVAPVFQELPAELSDRMAEAMKLFMAKGWSKEASAGIVGNLVGESGLNPAAYNPDDLGKPSGGIAQHRAERLEALQAYAASLGKAWTDLGVQVDFIDQELRTTEATTGAALRLAGTPGQASNTFLRGFERPLDPNGQAPVRAGYAEQAFGIAGGMPGYAPGQAQAALQAQLNDLQATYNQQLTETATLETENEAMAKDNALLAAKKSLLAQIEAEKANVDDLNKNYAATVELIKKGKLGDSKDVNDSRYKEILATAKELDTVEQAMNDKKERRGQLDSAEEAFKQRQVDIATRAAEATARITDPLEMKSTAAFRAMRTELEKYLTDVEAYYGRDSAEYKAAIDYKAQMLSQFKNMEVSEAAAAYAADAIQIRRSLMTQAESRKAALDEELARIDRQVAAFRGSEEEKVEIVRAAEEKKAALRDQYAAATVPFVGQMKEWGDFATNLGKSTTGWMDSMASGIVGLIDGTSNLRDIIGSIAKDMATMALKWAFSQAMGGGSKGASVPKIGSNAEGTDNWRGGWTTVHEKGGELLNLPSGTQIIPHDVSMEAARSAGYASASMSRDGAFSQSNQMAVSFGDINIDGSGGSPEQNADLAAKTAAAFEGKIRQVFADEMVKAHKAGNMLNR